MALAASAVRIGAPMPSVAKAAYGALD